MNNTAAAFKKWLENTDEQTAAELRAIEADTAEVDFRFSVPLEFGTAGIRGIMRAGINGMNVYTVRRATEGLAAYIISEGKASKGVAVAYDSRRNSEIFAKAASEVLAANGIPVYIFDELRPTPMLSFAVRELGCIAGINITASHNPAEYNGYKAYWEDGAQLSPERAAAVFERIQSIDIFDGVKRIDFDTAVKEGKINIIDKHFDDRYVAVLKQQLVNKTAVEKAAGDLKVVYTPLHGAGYRIVPDALRKMGLKHLYTVAEQMEPDGDFPTAKYPNPENADVFTPGIKLADEVGSDLIIATDPDADRVGTMVRGKDGKFITLSGNQMGALLTDYIISAYLESGTMPKDPYVVKSIVSTELVTRICRENGVALHNVLTGFRFIGEVIKNEEEAGRNGFIFGFEESYGYLKGSYARDKDAVIGSMLICEMAASCRAKGMTLCDALEKLWEKYGYSLEKVENIVISGNDAADKMKRFVAGLRENAPSEIGGYGVSVFRDYLHGTVTDMKSGKVGSTNLPASNVLFFETEAGDTVVVRPSGTEPKIKIYFLIAAKDAAEADKKLSAYRGAAAEWQKKYM